jgi:hypothetical protein
LTDFFELSRYWICWRIHKFPLHTSRLVSLLFYTVKFCFLMKILHLSYMLFSLNVSIALSFFPYLHSHSDRKEMHMFYTRQGHSLNGD